MAISWQLRGLRDYMAVTVSTTSRFGSYGTASRECVTLAYMRHCDRTWSSRQKQTVMPRGLESVISVSCIMEHLLERGSRLLSSYQICHNIVAIIDNGLGNDRPWVDRMLYLYSF